ncbi:MAG: hypothetical protein HF312_17500 [Ignavibacteria bacterium]|jgi:hypothetical protein|nr:hypothetical protein [Ignavibacteria bacterium]MCU7522014.1 hypothetical protein [Ignavibacteria bacterium]
MGILLGPFDPLQLILNTLDKLLRKNLITVQEAKDILYRSLDPSMAESEKQKVLDDIVRVQ